MPLPTPPVPLKDHCSLIYNDTLYTYQVDAFQSLSLQEGATWTQLPMGVPTNGSACVQGSVDNQDAFIVVGGTASAQNYQGLQHYCFATKQWQTDTPLDTVADSRVGHGSAFLSESSSILMYGGSQTNNLGPSSQTFVIETTPPYNVQAFESDAPPVTSPLMLPWNTTHALMLGGDSMNTNLFTFGPQDGWQQLNVSLQNGLKDSSMVQATILDGSDGSKVLEIFDMSTSPNQISTLLLQNATTTSSSTKKSRSYSSIHHPSKRRKRDTSLANRPAYNNTLAPQDTRNGFSLAEDPKTGLVIASGGGDQVPIAIFNSTGNQWIDPNQFFGSSPTATSSSPSVSNTATTGPPAASSSAAGAAHNVKNKSLTILGAVLGGVFGVAILLALILLLLRYCRKKKQKRQRGENSYSLDNKAEMDFADVGADFMKEAGGNFEGSNHRRKRSDKSNASVHNKAISPRAGAASAQSQRALLHAKGDSTGSGKSFWSRGTKSPEKSPPFISAPILGSPKGTTGSPEPRPEPRTDTGWSRYFTNNNSKDFATMTAEHKQDTRPGTYASNAQSQSDYADSSHVFSSDGHASAEVQPLSFRASQAPRSYPSNTRIVSPTSAHPDWGLALTHGAGPMANKEPGTPTSLVSDIEEGDEYRHSDGQDSWTPVAANGERESTSTDPRISSFYENYPHPGERVRIPNFPNVPNSQRPSISNSNVVSPTQPTSEQDRGLRNVASRDFARTPSGRRIPEAGSGRLPDYGTSEVRTFPRKKEDMGPRGRGSSQTEDMSWLNLGTSAEQNNNHLHFGP